MMIPLAHHTQPSDSGVNLDFLARSSSGVNMMIANAIVNDTAAADDDVFKRPLTPPLKNDEINNILTSSSSLESSSSSNTVTEQQSPLSPNNALCRSRRSHFSRKDSTPDKSKSDGEFHIKNLKLKLLIFLFYLYSFWCSASSATTTATNLLHCSVALVVL